MCRINVLRGVIVGWKVTDVSTVVVRGKGMRVRGLKGRYWRG